MGERKDGDTVSEGGGPGSGVEDDAVAEPVAEPIPEPHQVAGVALIDARSGLDLDGGDAAVGEFTDDVDLVAVAVAVVVQHHVVVEPARLADELLDHERLEQRPSGGVGRLGDRTWALLRRAATSPVSVM